MISPQAIRQAIRCEHKAQIYYQDVKETQTARTIWPFALAYFDGVQLLVAWCELREGFRHFRVDRIHELNISPERYPRRRQALLKAWQESQGIDSL
jgi:predicted DNA-binding transcriptional regulator YafY